MRQIIFFLMLSSLLVGCENADVKLVKNTIIENGDFTYGQSLSNGQHCSKIRWKSVKDENQRQIVIAECEFSMSKEMLARYKKGYLREIEIQKSSIVDRYNSVELFIHEEMDKIDQVYRREMASLAESMKAMEKNLGAPGHNDNELIRSISFRNTQLERKKEEYAFMQGTSERKGDYLLYIDHGMGKFIRLRKARQDLFSIRDSYFEELEEKYSYDISNASFFDKEYQGIRNFHFSVVNGVVKFQKYTMEINGKSLDDLFASHPALYESAYESELYYPNGDTFKRSWESLMGAFVYFDIGGFSLNNFPYKCSVGYEYIDSYYDVAFRESIFPGCSRQD